MEDFDKVDGAPPTSGETQQEKNKDKIYVALKNLKNGERASLHAELEEVFQGKYGRYGIVKVEDPEEHGGRFEIVSEQSYVGSMNKDTPDGSKWWTLGAFPYLTEEFRWRYTDPDNHPKKENELEKYDLELQNEIGELKKLLEVASGYGISGKNCVGFSDVEFIIKKSEEKLNTNRGEKLLGLGAKLHENGKFYYETKIHVEGGYEGGGRWKKITIDLLPVVNGDPVSMEVHRLYDWDLFKYKDGFRISEGKGGGGGKPNEYIALEKDVLARVSLDIGIPEDELFDQLVLIIRTKMETAAKMDLSHMGKVDSHMTL